MKPITALATPFENGKIKISDYVRLLELQRNADCDVLCCGTTAEHGMLSSADKEILITTAREVLPNGKIWVGVGGCTDAAARESVCARKFGADGVMVAPPSFFKCTKEGFLRHIDKIACECELPVMLYNAPSRCGYTLWQDAVETLAKRYSDGVGKSRIWLKDAGSDIGYADALAATLPLLCGNESKLDKFAKIHACGVVSVVSNLTPHLVRAVWEIFCKTKTANKNTATTCDSTAASGDMCDEREKKLVEIYFRIVKAAFCELSPIPIKYMLNKAQIFSTCEMRLPLTSACAATRAEIDKLQFDSVEFEPDFLKR